MKRLGSGTVYAPLWFFVGYLTITLWLAVFGPLDYIGFSAVKVTAFVAYVVICCGVGYYFGVESYKELTLPPVRIFQIMRKGVPKLFDLILAVAVAGMGAYLIASVLGGGLNMDVTALGDAYNSSYEGYQRNTGSYSLSFIAYSFISAPVFISSVWGMFYFGRIKYFRKAMVLSVIIGGLLIFTLGSGKMKQLGDLIIYIIAIAAIARAINGRGFGPRFIATLAAFAMAGIFLFAFIVGQRYSLMGVDALNINLATTWRIKYDTSHPVFEIFGFGTGFALSLVSGYLSQGYYGLGLALDSAPTWSHFMGSSYSMSVIGERLLGLPSGYATSYPYLTGLETGWGESHWYTIFPWFASDFTFFGVGIVFALFAFWYGRAWLECITLAEPFAILLFTLMTVGVFYVPANNQLMHSPGGLATLILVVILYVLSAKRRRWMIAHVWSRMRASGDL